MQIRRFIPLNGRKSPVRGGGARLLAYQDSSGLWSGQLYNGKWTSTTYTLQILYQMGLDPENPQARQACRLLLDGGFREGGGFCFAKSKKAVDNGVTGLVLAILAYLGSCDPRVVDAIHFLLGQQMPDGRWEPFPGNLQARYSFDTTLLVLVGLHEYEKRFPDQADLVVPPQSRGREFLLSQALFRNRSTGENISPAVTLFSFPPRWHYDLLAALDYFRDCRSMEDKRLQEAITLLRSKQNPDGSWNLQNRHSGKTFFEMEAVGKPSRWNTLRALRVLKEWENR